SRIDWGLIRTQVYRAGGRIVSNSRKDRRTGGSIQPVHIEILVYLNVTATGTNIHVQRNRCLEITRKVAQELSSAFPCKVPDNSDPRLSVLEKSIQLDVRRAAVTEALLVVPPHPNIHLNIADQFPLVLHIMTERSGGRRTVKLIIADACAEPDQKGIIVRFSLGDCTSGSGG